MKVSAFCESSVPSVSWHSSASDFQGTTIASWAHAYPRVLQREILLSIIVHNSGHAYDRKGWASSETASSLVCASHTTTPSILQPEASCPRSSHSPPKLPAMIYGISFPLGSLARCVHFHRCRAAPTGPHKQSLLIGGQGIGCISELSPTLAAKFQGCPTRVAVIDHLAKGDPLSPLCGVHFFRFLLCSSRLSSSSSSLAEQR